MIFSHKGQSTLENVITVTLVLSALFVSWQLINDLTGGAIKNLVKDIEEPDPHRFIRQDDGRTGVSPICQCTDWIPPLCDDTKRECGDERKQYRKRTCTPPGCQPDKVCEFHDRCCTQPKLITPAPFGCGIHVGCPDGQGMAWWQCGDPAKNNVSKGCRTFPECNFSCQKPITNSGLCVGSDKRLPDNLDIALVKQCSDKANRPPPYQTYGDRCLAVCTPPYIYDEQSKTCRGCKDKSEPLPDCGSDHEKCCVCLASTEKGGCHGKIWTNPLTIERKCEDGTFAVWGQCEWRHVAHGGNPGGFTHNGPIDSKRTGWRCTGRPTRPPQSGETCHRADLHLKVYCEPEERCPKSPPGPMVFKSPTVVNPKNRNETIDVCGDELQAGMYQQECLTKIIGDLGNGWYKRYDCRGNEVQRTWYQFNDVICPMVAIGHLSLKPIGPKVYQERAVCEAFDQQFSRGTHYDADRVKGTTLTASSTCQTALGVDDDYGYGKGYHDCSDGTYGHRAPQTCSTEFSAHLSSGPVQGGRPIYKLPSPNYKGETVFICSSKKSSRLTTNPTCKTVPCQSQTIIDRTNGCYYSKECFSRCDGSCPHSYYADFIRCTNGIFLFPDVLHCGTGSEDNSKPATCGTDHVGYLLP